MPVCTGCGGSTVQKRPQRRRGGEERDRERVGGEPSTAGEKENASQSKGVPVELLQSDGGGGGGLGGGYPLNRHQAQKHCQAEVMLYYTAG